MRQMNFDFATVIGLASGFGLLLIAVILGGAPMAFFDLSSLLIVLGGTFAVTMVCFSLGDVLRAQTVMFKTIFNRLPDVADSAYRMVELAELARRDGVLGLEARLRQIDREPLLHKALSLVIDGTASEELDRIMRHELMAIRAGAKEYLPLPPEPELIAALLEAVTEESHALLFEDDAMADVVHLADQVAGSEASILITGESGTGKEVMARYLHRKSRRSAKTFVSVNCAAIPDNLLESELFGHEKGAFTGAVARRVGKFEEADGGTLLLDEISEMEPRLQAKLLRAIQEREIDRVGGTKPVLVDIRLLATSNLDLAEEVRKGNFREDLLFRLNVVNLQMPPLRERPRDVDLLAHHFAAKYAEVNGVPARPLAPETMELLRVQPWPGNVRELENTMHRAILLANGDSIEPEAILTPDGRRSAPAIAGPVSYGESEFEVFEDEPATQALVGRTVADVERDLIIDTLYHCLGNRTHAANILGISIRTLRNKLRQYGDDGVRVPSPGEARPLRV